MVIATRSGASFLISGPADILHTHRLRALFDAIVVGAGTVQADDPLLTTRACSGESPVRVVIDTDPGFRDQRRVFGRSGDAGVLRERCARRRNGRRRRNLPGAASIARRAVEYSVHSRGPCGARLAADFRRGRRRDGLALSCRGRARSVACDHRASRARGRHSGLYLALP